MSDDGLERPRYASELAGPQEKATPDTTSASTPPMEPPSNLRLEIPSQSDTPSLMESAIRKALINCKEIINLTVIADQLGVQRSALWEFIRVRPDLLALIDASRLAMVDLADRQLRDSIYAEKGWAVGFMLGTKGKDSFGGSDEPRPSLRTPKPKRQLAKSEPAPSENVEIPELEQRARTLWSQARKLAPTAKKLGVTSTELFYYLAVRPKLLPDVIDRREELADQAESKLYRAITNVRPWGVTFTLETLGKSRGYTRGPRLQWPRSSNNMSQAKAPPEPFDPKTFCSNLVGATARGLGPPD